MLRGPRRHRARSSAAASQHAGVGDGASVPEARWRTASGDPIRGAGNGGSAAADPHFWATLRRWLRERDAYGTSSRFIVTLGAQHETHRDRSWNRLNGCRGELSIPRILPTWPEAGEGSEDRRRTTTALAVLSRAAVWRAGAIDRGDEQCSPRACGFRQTALGRGPDLPRCALPVPRATRR